MIEERDPGLPCARANPALDPPAQACVECSKTCGLLKGGEVGSVKHESCHSFLNDNRRCR